MKIQRINRFFKKIGELLIRYRWPLLLITVLFTALGFSGLQYVRMASDTKNWFDKGDQIQIAQDRFEEQFGNNDFIGLLIQSDDVFHPEVLTMIRDIGNELIEKVPYADEVTSLMELELTVGTEDSIEVINPYANGVPTDPAELKKQRDFILSRQSVVNKIVRRDISVNFKK